MAALRETGTVIYWPEVCATADDPGLFWDSSLSINTPSPDLTDCFQDTVVVWLPCFVLWLAAPFWLGYVAGNPIYHGMCHFSCLQALKQVVSVLLVAGRIADLAFAVQDGDNSPTSRWIADIVFAVTILFSVYLSRREFRRGIHSSGVLFCFWLLVTCACAIMFYSQVTRRREGRFPDTVRLGLTSASFALAALQFALHTFADYGSFATIETEEDSIEKKPLLMEEKAPREPSEEQRPPNPSPEKWASFINNITYVWTTPLLLLGYKRQLDATKLWDLNDSELSKPLLDTFYKNWIGSSKKSSRFDDSSHVIIDDVKDNGKLPSYKTVSGRHRTPKHRKSHDTAPQLRTWKTQSSFYWAIIKSFGGYYALIGIFEAINIILTFVRPLIQDALIAYVESDTSYPWQGYSYALALFGVTIVRAIINQQHFIGKMLSGMRIRSALTAAVYRKSLLLANSARKDYSIGEIVNLMAVDAQRVSDCTFYLHNLWSAPVNVTVAMVLLWQYLGPSCMAGFAILMLLVFSNIIFARIVKGFQVHTMRYKDQRTKLTSEVLNGIKVLKLYAWEDAFQKRLLEIRDSELSYIQKSALYFSGTIISFTCAPVLFAVVAFSLYIAISGNATLSARVAFVSLSLLGSLTRPLTFLPNGIANFVQAQVSVKRLNDYLNKDELDPNTFSGHCTGDNALQLHDASFSWDGDDNHVLHNINLDIPRSSFTCIVGQVGSGKSSLLSAVLGELHKTSGELAKRGSVAYVPQEAWIRNDTLEKNVLFGQNKQPQIYNKALDACALRPDLKMLAAGDQTEIGEKGINLSGGQKQRVSLARSLYADCDIYLLDDPLSAVDSHVGKHIFNEVIGPTGLLQGKTRVLVTHGVTYLPKADQIVVMKDGRISEVGTYKDLLQSDGAFADFIMTYLTEATEDEDDDEEQEIRGELIRQISENLQTERISRPLSLDIKRQLSSRQNSVEGTSQVTRRKSRHSKGRKESDGSAPAVKGPGGPPGFGGRGGPGGRGGHRLIDAEATQSGGVNFRVLMEYMEAVGWWLVALVLLTNVFQIATDLGSNIWLSKWSEDVELESRNLSYTDPTIRVGVYAGLGLGTTVGVATQAIAMAFACTIGSRVLHKALLERIMRAPMSFFDTTPIGRILNRFSQDMNVADSAVRMTVIALFRGLTSLVSTIIAITYATPIFLVIIIPLAIGYYFLQRFYVMTSNQLRRLMNVRTSPIYSHFGETVAGASSIRAYHRQEDFIEDSDRRLDNMQMAKYPALIVNRWLSVWLEFLGSLVVLFAGMFAIVGKGSVTGGLVGLSISYSLQVTDRLAFLLRNVSDLENNVVSLERIKEYSSVEQEAPWRVPGNAPPATWPEEGQIRINDYSTRYRPGLDLVLKNIFCNINGQEKVGIVGRTGAGKSSITLALFRLIEAVHGHVIIDDVDTGKIGLHDLRSKLTIIPQDPTLFSGSLRFNLDPLDERTDDALWDALGHAHLRDFVKTLPEGLLHPCQEGGSNLSVGQRQLVCLARALLRKTKILVLDEATAAIDLETDNLIQNTIRTEFAGCTVLTIAHRLHTVMDYDRIMILDGGQIKEFDTPEKLLEVPGGIFRSMCRDAGLLPGDTEDSLPDSTGKGSGEGGSGGDVQ